MVSLDQAVDSSGWPEQVLKDVCKRPFVVESPESFLSFVRYADHSQAQMCILRDGLQKLALETSLPQALREACTQHRTAVEAVVAFQDAYDFELNGDVFTWPGASGGYSCKRTEIKGGSMCQRLTRAEAAETDDGLIYVAELSRAKKTAHHLTGECCRTLTNKDVRDCADVSFHPGTDVVELPMWDRGHSFVGAPGVGSCLHVDQAWWSNVAKNFTGHKLVALWGPGHAEEIVQRHEGELFRRPLSPEQTQALSKAAVIALLQPGDVASFSGGLPHATVVVGTELNLTAYVRRAAVGEPRQLASRQCRPPAARLRTERQGRDDQKGEGGPAGGYRRSRQTTRIGGGSRPLERGRRPCFAAAAGVFQ